jgi:hypothetical protein
MSRWVVGSKSLSVEGRKERPAPAFTCVFHDTKRTRPVYNADFESRSLRHLDIVSLVSRLYSYDGLARTESRLSSPFLYTRHTQLFIAQLLCLHGQHKAARLPPMTNLSPRYSLRSMIIPAHHRPSLLPLVLRVAVSMSHPPPLLHPLDRKSPDTPECCSEDSARNPRRRQHEPRTTNERPKSPSTYRCNQRPDSDVFGISDDAPEGEDETGAEEAKKGAGATGRYAWSCFGVVEVAKVAFCGC